MKENESLSKLVGFLKLSVKNAFEWFQPPTQQETKTKMGREPREYAITVLLSFAV